MLCKNCGKEINKGALYCEYCGKNIENDGVKRAVAIAALLLALGTAAGVFYFTGDAYVSRKNLKLAEKCYEEEEYEEALSYCREALERDFALTDAYLLQADILQAEEKFEEAVQNLEKGLTRTKQDEKAQGLLAEKIDEVNRAEAAAVTARFQKYLDQELAPRYGYAKMDSQIKEFDQSALSQYGPSEKDIRWTGVTGIVFARICDWDQDGRDELLTMVQEEKSKNLYLYELEDGKVVKKSECPVQQSDDMAQRDEIWLLLDAESGKYLYSSLDYHGVIVDEIHGEANLYRYDGKNLYTPLIFEYKSEPESSDCRVSQYNEKGELLLSESVYGFLHDGPDYERKPDREHCEKRMTELFAQYGIVWDSDENIPAAGSGNEELARLCVWHNYRESYLGDGTYVYHFNDWDSPLPVYERFLQGRETLRMRGDVADIWFGSEREEWTFQEILESVEHSRSEYSGQEVSEVEYAFIDCGGDGVEEMLLRFLWPGANRQESWDDGTQIAVIFCNDGELELVYMDETWERAALDITYDGLISSLLSPNMGRLISTQRYIDGNGDLQTVYSTEDLWGQCVSYLSEAAYNEAFAKTGDYDPNMGIMRYEIKDEEYCVLYEGGDTEECRYFISLCEQEGKCFVTKEEMDNLLIQRLGEVRDETRVSGNELHWEPANWVPANAKKY
ncbi:MAG: zinc-ribbon domain-containing protein [Clostridium sp.]|nr:zinc-ribbon domain-containing protein [Clostridium sp.]